MALTAKRRQQARQSIRAYKTLQAERRVVEEQAAMETRANGQGVPVDHGFFLPDGRDGTDIARFLSDPFSEHANFFSVVSALAWSFIQAPFQLGRWGDDSEFVPAESHALDGFFRRPNGLCSGPLFWWLRMVHLSTVGEAFVVLEGEEPGSRRTSAQEIPGQGWLFPGGSRWTPTEKVGADGLPIGWVYEGPQQQEVYLRHELVYSRYPHPRAPIRGLPPAKPAAPLLLADLYADRYQVATLKNDGKPGGVLKNNRIPRLTDVQFAQAREQWEDRQTGFDNTRRVAVMTGGWEFEPLSWSPADLEYLEQRRFTREQLCAIFRVPKWMLSSTDDINRAISAEMRAAFWEDVIDAHHKMAVGDFESQLLRPIDDDLTARFLLDDVPAMQAARRERWKAATEALKAGITLREANRQFDLGVDKNNEPPGYDTVYKPSGVQVVNEDGTLAGPAGGLAGPFGFSLAYNPQSPEAPAGDAEPLVVPVGLAAQTARNPIERARLLGYENSDAWRNLSWRAKLTAVQRRQQWLRWTEGVRAPADEMIAKIVRPWLSDLADDILERFDEEAERSRVIPHWSNGGGRVLGPEDLESLLFSAEETGAKLADAMRPAAVQIARLSAAFTSGEQLSFTEIDLLSPEVQAFIEERMQKLVSDFRGSIPNLVREQLSLTLQDGFAAGDTLQELRVRISTFHDSLKGSDRTLTIARTESGTLANGLRYAVAKANVDSGEWLTSGLGNSRDTHLADEAFSTNSPVPVGTRFPNTGLLYPQESGGPADEVINCACLHLLVPRTS